MIKDNHLPTQARASASSLDSRAMLSRCLMILAVSTCSLAISARESGASDDWLQFRGSNGDSIALDAELPTEWTVDEVDWKIELPGRGVGGAIVVGEQVITTSSEGAPQQDRLHVFSVDAETGELNWRRSLWATGRTNCHPLSSMSAPTPASDGERIYVLFASNDLICLNLQGSPVWMRALGEENQYAFDDRGLASSPTLVGDTLVIQVECQGDSFVEGIDKLTGQSKWKHPLAQETCWSTPVTIPYSGRPHVVVQAADEVMLIEPNRGEVVWTLAASSGRIPSPAAVGSRLFVPSTQMIAIDLPSEGQPASPGATEPAWSETRLAPSNASPVIVEGNLLALRGSILTCGDATDGTVKWRQRIEGNGFWATPVVAGQHIYIPSAEGRVTVIDWTSESGEIVGESDFGEEMLGTPAIAKGAIYFRGVGSLYRVSSGEN